MTGEPEHRTEFHDSMDELRTDVVRVGAMLIEMIRRGTSAFLARDLAEAKAVIERDDTVDVLALDIEDRVYKLIALQAPMAKDLRFLMTSIRLVTEMERSCDLMCNVCKALRRMYDVEVGPVERGLIERMSREAVALTQHALDAFVDNNSGLATALDDMDDGLDDLQVDFIEAVFGSHQGAGIELRVAVQLALIGRFYERIGDHAVNMGERIAYMVTGWLPEHAALARARMAGAEPDEA